MIVNFPVPPGQITQQYVVQILDILRKTFVSTVSKDQSVPRILLEAPNGTVYTVTVSNTGTLTTVVNSGKTRDI
jgi:hypothetical protein